MSSVFRAGPFSNLVITPLAGRRKGVTKLLTHKDGEPSRPSGISRRNRILGPTLSHRTLLLVR